MREDNVIRGFATHDRSITVLQNRLGNLEKAYDKLYLNFLTQQMMWDCLMGLLTKKKVFSEGEFTEEMEGLKVATRAAFEADQRRRADEAAGVRMPIVPGQDAAPAV